MNRWLRPALDRFQAAEDSVGTTFREKLGAFVALYSYLSQIMPFGDVDLEKRYGYLRYLAKALPKDSRRNPLDLDDDVALRYYRLSRIASQAVTLKAGEAAPVYGPVDVGTRQAQDEEVRLSEIIEVLNEKFGTDFTDADQLLFDQFVRAAAEDATIVARARANPFDNFAVSMRQTVEDLMVQRHDENQAIVDRYLNDRQFQDVLFTLLARRIYEDLRRT